MVKQTKILNEIKRKKPIFGIIISICTLTAMYLGGSAYFKNRFYLGSTINCISASGKTVKEVDDVMSSEVKSYVLELKERGNKTEQINASDISLVYNPDGQIQSIKDKQSPLKWISAFFNSNDFKLDRSVSYDDAQLKKHLDNLACFDSKNITEPKDASLKYTDSGYVLVDEVNGNKVNKDALYDNIVKAILQGEKSIDLEALKCYENPKFTSKSQEVIDAKKTLNKYVSSKITYTFGSRTEVLDGSKINSWLEVDDNFNINFDENKVKSYINTLAKNYNTVEKNKEFTTSYGTNVTVSGGDYGWRINSSKEVPDLINAIKEGKAVTKEPIYSQTAATRDGNDIGKTYVEINLTKQHLWFYKNGSLVVEGDVVTGNVSNGNATPGGIYSLKYKQKDATLKGENYQTPVSYWMPFNGNIGIHDAYWRDIFGGVEYLNNGSHGCVNCPPELAKTIFSNIDAGTPIVCYFE